MLNLRSEKTGSQKMGIFFEIDSPLAMECIALSGFDFAIVDLEHGPLCVQGAVELICRGQLHGLSVLVRPQDASRTAILKALDAGADGLVVPGIRSLEQARQAVSYGKYGPIGDRGVALTRAASYGYGPGVGGLTQLFEVKNRETVLLLQCETSGCLNQIEEIAALDGVDGIFIGPYDLSTDLGLAGQFGHERFIAALERVYAACCAVQKPVLIFSPNAQDAQLRLAQGFDAVAVSTVSSVLVEGCKHLLKEAQGGKN